MLAIAGALVAAPHSLKILSETVDLPGVFAGGYGIAAFVGLELGLLALSFVSALYQVHHTETRKIASLAGMINALALRVGTSPPFNLDHLPDRRNSKRGGLLVGALLIASLTFNLADTISTTALLAPYTEQIQLIARVVSGCLGPGLLTIAGHHAAQEAVQAETRRRRAEATYSQTIADWTQACNASWAQVADGAIADLLHERGYEAPASEHERESNHAPFGPSPTNGKGQVELVKLDQGNPPANRPLF
jgi:hypothetical protein